MHSALGDDDLEEAASVTADRGLVSQPALGDSRVATSVRVLCGVRFAARFLRSNAPSG
jgi:hypothetical protein